PGLGWLWDGTHPGTIITNALWTSFNIVILSVCVAVAREARQTRTHVRINFTAPVRALLPDGRMIPGQTIDVSSGGLAMELLEGVEAQEGEAVRVVFPLRTGDAELPGRVVDVTGGVLRVHFDPLTVAEEEMLTMVLFSRADSWLGWGESRDVDQPLRSLGRIVKIAFRGMGLAIRSMRRRNGKTRRRALPTESLTVLLLGLGLLGWAAKGRAQTAPANAGASRPAGQSQAAATGTGASAAGTFKTTTNFFDFGTTQAIKLHGTDGFYSIYFSLPQDQVAKQASLHLVYHFSPSLLPSLSHLKLMLNGTLFATVPVPQNSNGGALETDLPLPAELLVRSNELTFEFIGHYTEGCEDPLSSTLWAQVDPNSAITVAGSLLPLTDELKNLPLPFFDAKLSVPPVIPVVFGATPSLQGLEAAGVVTSWLGALADYRAVRFPVSVGTTLPPGNVVLIAEDGNAVPPGLNLAAPNAPTVAIRTNPVDPYGKVLIITGGDAGQTLEAAQAVATGWPGLQGNTAMINEVNLPAKSRPDDAPRWEEAGNRVKLVNFSTPQELEGNGDGPLVAYYRVPPDLYYGDKQNVLLHLDYRYNSVPIGPISSMQVESNEAYLGSVPFEPGKDVSKKASANMALPVVNLRPFSNSMKFLLTFQQLRPGNCRDTVPPNLMGSILGSSYIDLRGLPHWTALPNLELFSNAGFPFTRYADLSETQVVLPEQPSKQEIETYLTLLGHFGAETGYPALRVTVTGPDALRSGNDADLLVIGTGQDNSAVSQLGPSMPVTVGENNLKVQDTRGFFSTFHNAWWKIPTTDELPSGDIGATGVPDALIEEIESPYEGGRTVVVVEMKNADVFEPMMGGFLESAQSSAVSGTVALLSGRQFESYRIGKTVYHVGALPWWTALSLWFSEVPWMVDLVVLVISLIFAVWIRGWLRARARRRLLVIEES
ncbi:MAG: cellulose biosynthesis cyclic di-GMP-binding regulatory protein BcsB, partial [Acidobacteriaceae bacterium]